MAHGLSGRHSRLVQVDRLTMPGSLHPQEEHVVEPSPLLFGRGWPRAPSSLSPEEGRGVGNQFTLPFRGGLGKGGKGQGGQRSMLASRCGRGQRSRRPLCSSCWAAAQLPVLVSALPLSLPPGTRLELSGVLAFGWSGLA